MPILQIESLDEFEKLRPIWQKIHSTDPNSHLFTSWAWLRGYYEASLYPWLILAYKPQAKADIVAFLPLSIQKRRIGRTLRLAGAPIADYTSFICLPQYEHEALSLFATYIQNNLHWDNFILQDVADERLDSFVTQFPTNMIYSHSEAHHPCPYIPLPTDWDTYLKTLSKNRRKKLKRRTAQLESQTGFYTRFADKDNIDTLLTMLFNLWQRQWGSGLLPIYEPIIKQCLRYEKVWLATVWREHEPMGGLCCFIEPDKGTMYSFMSGYSEAFSHLSPGTVLDGYSIRYAIEEGYQIYDYLRGNHAYKFSLGAVERYNRRAIIVRNTLRSNTLNKLMERTNKL